MGTIRDYIKWRGDLEFDRDGFNTIDNLILSVVSYVEMDGFFRDFSKPVNIGDICDIFFREKYDEKRYRQGSVLHDAPLILREIADTPRFRNIRVRNYLSLNDTERVLQFAAMEFMLPDGTSYVAYRGTDDTLVGWKEDFFLAIRETEAEKEAVSYLNRIAAGRDRPLRLGGHSKGGHLAVYAGAECKEKYRDRIISIYSNDGPGFKKDVAESDSVRNVIPKLVSIIPEESIVGLLMNPVIDPVIVKSTAKYAYQHNPASWCLEGTELEKVEKTGKASAIATKLIKENIGRMSPEELDLFVEDLFAVFEASGARTVSGLKKGGLKSLRAMASKLKEEHVLLKRTETEALTQ